MKKGKVSKLAKTLGSLGAKARAKNLSKEQRSMIAKKASEARWATKI